jgi:S1-C subfamily serine protease
MRSLFSSQTDIERSLGAGVLVILSLVGMVTTVGLAIASPAISQAKSVSPESSLVPEVARLVSVRIFTQDGAGSGVLIKRQGSIYSVLTCHHVVADEETERLQILTADGVTHPARWLRGVRFGNLDLALVQFQSQKSYRVAVLGDSGQLKVGDRLYAAGFPNYYFPHHANYVEATDNWGMRAFVLTTGEVSMLPSKSLPRGYSLGYTNQVREGMSGGAVLNHKGEVVGINGRLKYPLQGIDAFSFADGSKPSQALFEQMEASSWAIPIGSFQQRSPF